MPAGHADIRLRRLTVVEVLGNHPKSGKRGDHRLWRGGRPGKNEVPSENSRGEVSSASACEPYSEVITSAEYFTGMKRASSGDISTMVFPTVTGARQSVTGSR